ncbi:DUF2812 domain-containing protein [Clostridium septicum]|uniref:DUF2812 domain-containing protein n=1 Tax=Clostridium septicum TaxID=1504 RepID=UPI003216E5BB
MKKFKCFTNFIKEEKWLNEMANEGYRLKNVSFGYTFEKSKPENSIIKIDYRKFKTKDDFIDYCTLFEDSGWEHIVGTMYSGIQYFKKVNTSSSYEDIFSDNLSKAAVYKRLSLMWFNLAISYIVVFLPLLYAGYIDISALIKPKNLYYTPGLWSMTGSDFWFHFLFETPFALGRGFLWIIFPVFIILYLIASFKSQRLYKASKLN